MGVKSTVTLTRKEAETKYIDLYVQVEKENWVKRCIDGMAIVVRIDIEQMLQNAGVPEEKCRRLMIDVLWDGQGRSEQFMARQEIMSSHDKHLENELERLNDLVHDGEGFENYIIQERIE